MNSILRGDVCAFRPSRGSKGHEQRGLRFAVVLQSNEFEWLSTIVAAPTSTVAQPAIFRPELKLKGKRTRILLDQVLAADRSRLGAKVGHLALHEMAEVELALGRILGLA